MRFGCCVKDRAQIDVLAAAGYDFCELPAGAVMPFADEITALPVLRDIASASIRPESFNLLVPGTLPLLGPRHNREALQAYLQRAFQRMTQLGGSIAVLGSSAARRIPDDLPRPQALSQLADAVHLLAEEASRAGIIVALEHLNRSESNVFTSLAECQAFITDHSIPHAMLLADLYHLEVEQEPLVHVTAAGPLLAHVHIADSGRRAPGTGDYPLGQFMRVLQQVGYDRRISIECSWEDLAGQAQDSLHYIRQTWHNATT